MHDASIYCAASCTHAPAHARSQRSSAPSLASLTLSRAASLRSVTRFHTLSLAMHTAGPSSYAHARPLRAPPLCVCGPLSTHHEPTRVSPCAERAQTPHSDNAMKLAVLLISVLLLAAGVEARKPSKELKCLKSCGKDEEPQECRKGCCFQTCFKRCRMTSEACAKSRCAARRASS